MLELSMESLITKYQQRPKQPGVSWATHARTAFQWQATAEGFGWWNLAYQALEQTDSPKPLTHYPEIPPHVKVMRCPHHRYLVEQAFLKTPLDILWALPGPPDIQALESYFIRRVNVDHHPTSDILALPWFVRTLLNQLYHSVIATGQGCLHYDGTRIIDHV